ncbi:hypothetical protein J4733_01070 [Klebsiella pneumoniae]|uniref:Uncharacterized protein n=1 Tax=Klebsiella pneumoniae TaxID=573 RepID=A0A939NR35_KLEPN|nr:hypothetical protein [Klebsiella pneumoniae]
MPNSSCSTPAPHQEEGEGTRDSMAATTMVTSPAAGPLTAKREGLRAVTTKAADDAGQQADEGQAAGRAMPRHSGRRQGRRRCRRESPDETYSWGVLLR